VRPPFVRLLDPLLSVDFGEALLHEREPDDVGIGARGCDFGSITDSERAQHDPVGTKRWIRRTPTHASSLAERCAAGSPHLDHLPAIVGRGLPVRSTPIVHCVARELHLAGVDWNAVTKQLVTRGWARLERAVDPGVAAALQDAAPGPWTSLPESEGGTGVRQGGLACHSDIDGAADAVRSLARVIREGIDGAQVPDVPPLPAFNHAEWCRAERGEKFITPHRDPDTAGGIVAVLTIHGRALFRVWEGGGSLVEARGHPERAEEWETDDGDIVLLCGGGWPTATSRCAIHESRSPLVGDRMTLTLRHNKGGYGSDYFQ